MQTKTQSAPIRPIEAAPNEKTINCGDYSGFPPKTTVDKKIKEVMIMLAPLRGTPVTILAALHIYSKPASNNKLIQMTGLTDKTLARGVQKLKELDHIRKTPQGWVIISNIFSGVLNTFSVGEKALEGGPTNPMPCSSIILDLLNKAGINGIKAEEIASSPHAKANFVQAHLDFMKKNSVGTGLTITRILNNEPVPSNSKNIKNSKDPDPSRYISGEFADLIEH
jgi:hypothetical protein